MKRTSSANSSMSWWGRCLARCGIDTRMYAALVHAYLLMDFRNQQFAKATSISAKDVLSPLVIVVGQNLLVGCVVSGVLFLRVDAFFFALAGLGLTMLFTANAVLVEFNEVVLNPEDLEVVAHQPVPLRVYSAARITNLLGFVALITAALTLFPAVVGAGLRDAVWWFAPLYASMSLVAGLLAAGVVILLYLAAWQGRNNFELRERLAFAQFGMLVIVVMPLMFMLRWSTGGIQMFAYQRPDWLYWLPSAWLAMVVAPPAWLPWPATAGIASGAVVLTAALWGVVLARVTRLYAQIDASRTSSRVARGQRLTAPGQLVAGWEQWFLKPHEQRVGYWLAKTMLRRDPGLTMRTLPALLLVLVIAAAGWLTGQLGNPFAADGGIASLSLVALYLLPPAMITALFQLNFSDDHSAAWLLQATPLASRFDLTLGMHKAVVLHRLLPIIALLIVGLSLAWRQPLAAIAHVLPGVLTTIGAAYAAQALVLRRTPFGLPPSRGDSFGPIVLPLTAVSCAATGVGAMHYFASQSIMAYAAFVLALGGAVLVVRWLVRRTLATDSSWEAAA